MSTHVTEKDWRHKLTMLLALGNLGLFTARAVIAGIVFNDMAEKKLEALAIAMNLASTQTISTSLIGGCIGIASIGPALLHCKVWNEITRYLAFGVGLIAWLLAALTSGFAIKALDLDEVDPIPGDSGDRLYTVCVLSIVILCTQFLYLVFVQTFTHGQVMLSSQGAASDGDKGIAMSA